MKMKRQGTKAKQPDFQLVGVPSVLLEEKETDDGEEKKDEFVMPKGEAFVVDIGSTPPKESL